MPLKNVLVLAFAFWMIGCGASALADSDERSPGLIKGQLIATYTLNRHLNPFDIDIDVDGSTVHLSGTVNDSVKKELAEQIAKGVDGVERVRNNIKVEADYEQPARRDRSDRTFGDRVSDATTTATVKSKLLWNRHTGGLDINVDTRDGEVTLSGTAASDASRQVAERLAANTEGVKSVNNRIQIDPEVETRAQASRDRGKDKGEDRNTFSDGWITTKVKSTLLFSTNVSGTSISVETRDGVVHLEGEVESEAEKRRAIALAQDINGVKQVNADGIRVTRG